MQAILEVRDLHKSFRSSLWTPPVQALRGVSFAVREGECFGVLGRNGAGKTTTIKSLTGQIKPDKGEALLLGHSGKDASARRALGYLPENPYFHEHLTPHEGLELFGRLAGLSRADVRERRGPLLERVGLTAAADRRVRQFSKGMRQRYGLAAALLADPRVLILDEPLSGLDPGGRSLVKELVLEEREKGRTVLLCSHVLGDVQELCDRVAVFHQGVIVRQGAISELLDREARAFELTATAIPESLLAEMRDAASRFQQQDGVVRAVIPGADGGPEWAGRVHASGGQIRSLIPERETLEAWFVRLTEHAVEPDATSTHAGVEEVVS